MKLDIGRCHWVGWLVRGSRKTAVVGIYLFCVEQLKQTSKKRCSSSDLISLIGVVGWRLHMTTLIGLSSLSLYVWNLAFSSFKNRTRVLYESGFIVVILRRSDEVLQYKLSTPISSMRFVHKP